MRALASVGVLLLVFAMKRLALALMATALVLSAAKADETCKAEAREDNFTGEELQTYMANCKAVAAMVCDGKALTRSSRTKREPISTRNASRTPWAGNKAWVSAGALHQITGPNLAAPKKQRTLMPSRPTSLPPPQ